MVNVGYDLETSQLAVEQASMANNVVRASVGIHPHNALSFNEAALNRLRQLASDRFVVAIGETGLDFHRELSPREAQLVAFEGQLELACEVGKPVIVHIRKAFEEAYAILRRYSERLVGIVAHCFGGDKSTAFKFVDMGAYIGIAGNVTYRGANELHEVARSVPIERLLVETDAPYLAPIPHRGKRNEPSYLAHVIERVSELRQMTSEEVAQVTSKNAMSVFRMRFDGREW